MIWFSIEGQKSYWKLLVFWHWNWNTIDWYSIITLYRNYMLTAELKFQLNMSAVFMQTLILFSFNLYFFFVHSIWLDSNVPINRTFTNYFIWMLRPLVLNVGIILVILFVIFPITIRRLLCVCLLIGLLFSSSYDTLGIWWCSVYHKYLPIVFKWYY